MRVHDLAAHVAARTGQAPTSLHACYAVVSGTRNTVLCETHTNFTIVQLLLRAGLCPCLHVHVGVAFCRPWLTKHLFACFSRHTVAELSPNTALLFAQDIRFAHMMPYF